jgi:hypothetical protein
VPSSARLPSTTSTFRFRIVQAKSVGNSHVHVAQGREAAPNRGRTKSGRVGKLRRIVARAPTPFALPPNVVFNHHLRPGCRRDIVAAASNLNSPAAALAPVQAPPLEAGMHRLSEARTRREAMAQRVRSPAHWCCCTTSDFQSLAPR